MPVKYACNFSTCEAVVTRGSLEIQGKPALYCGFQAFQSYAVKFGPRSGGGRCLQHNANFKNLFHCLTVYSPQYDFRKGRDLLSQAVEILKNNWIHMNKAKFPCRRTVSRFKGGPGGL